MGSRICGNPDRPAGDILQPKAFFFSDDDVPCVGADPERTLHAVQKRGLRALLQGNYLPVPIRAEGLQTALTLPLSQHQVKIGALPHGAGVIGAVKKMGRKGRQGNGIAPVMIQGDRFVSIAESA